MGNQLSINNFKLINTHRYQAQNRLNLISDNSIENWHTPHKNQFLDALPVEVFNRLLPRLELVPMVVGQLLNPGNDKAKDVYFPTTSILSLQHHLANGATSEIAVIGNDGILGVAICMGGSNNITQAMVKHAGFGYKLKAQVLLEEFYKGESLMHFLLSYTQALMAQINQTAVCNRHHSTDQQLCRCILLSLDQLNIDYLPMTHDLISSLLGVRRESVTEAAGRLRKAKLIDYKRGIIQVLNRKGLEESVCECYAVVKSEYARLLPKKISSRALKPSTYEYCG